MQLRVGEEHSEGTLSTEKDRVKKDSPQMAATMHAADATFGMRIDRGQLTIENLREDGAAGEEITLMQALRQLTPSPIQR